VFVAPAPVVAGAPVVEPIVNTELKDLPPPPTEEERQRINSINVEIRAIEQRLIELMGTKVRIDGDFNKGTIKVEYYSKDDLERLYNLILE
jgi:ParB family chromosome partitioning protein